MRPPEITLNILAGRVQDTKRSALSLLYPLVQRLHDAGVDGSDDVDGGIELFFRHSRFPCVRKAPFRSGLAVARHRHGQTQQHLLSLAEARHAVRLAVKCAKIDFLHKQFPPFDAQFLVLSV